jgi:DNA-binding response OmpR family regulator
MADRAPRILLADDEQAIQTLLSYPLQKDGYEVVRASDGREALARFAEQPFDLVVLDVMMPRLDGLEVCRRLRSRSSVPIIMLTAKAEEIDKVLGLELGADDYITKPFNHLELMARVRAVLRRLAMPTPTSRAPSFQAGELEVDFAAHEARLRGARLDLTPTEYKLLYHLVRNAGTVLQHGTLLAKVWGREYLDEVDYLRVYVRRLRDKLGDDPDHPTYIRTERGLGYRFVAR